MSVSYKSKLMKDVPEDSIKSFPIIHHEDEEMIDVNIKISKESKQNSYKKYNQSRDKGKIGFNKKYNQNKDKSKFGFNKNVPEVSKSSKNKMEALFKVQDNLIRDCLPSKKDIEEIKLSLSCVSNWEGKKIYINTSSDELKIHHKDKDYTFSKKQFLKNNKFKFNLIKKYNEILDSSIWIDIKEKEIEDVSNHIIYINKKR
jgi:hypothetical protein